MKQSGGKPKKPEKPSRSSADPVKILFDSVLSSAIQEHPPLFGLACCRLEFILFHTIFISGNSNFVSNR